MVTLLIRQVYNTLSWWTTLLQKEFIGCLFTINMCTNTVYQSSPGLIFFGFWEVFSTDNHSSNKRKSELFQGTFKLVINGFQLKKTTLQGTNRAPDPKGNVIWTIAASCCEGNSFNWQWQIDCQFSSTDPSPPNITPHGLHVAPWVTLTGSWALNNCWDTWMQISG